MFDLSLENFEAKDIKLVKSKKSNVALKIAKPAGVSEVEDADEDEVII